MTPTRNQRWHLPILAFCTGALIGWWPMVDKIAKSQEADQAPVATRSSRSRPPRAQGSRKTEPEHVRRLLAAVRAARTPEDRQRAAIHLARNLPIAELAAWFDADWYPFRDGIDVNVFYRVARLRWLEEDPAGYLNRALVKKYDDTTEAAGQWATRDPEAALAWLQGLTSSRDFNTVADSVFRNLAKTRPALALAEILKLRGRMTHADSTVKGMLEELAGNSAAALRQAAANWPAGLRQQADQALTSDLLKRDFSAGLTELLGRDGGSRMFLQSLNDDPALAAKLIDHLGVLPEGWFSGALKQSGGWNLANQNPDRWLQVDLATLGLDEATAAGFRKTTLNCLANKDPAAAWKALEATDMEPSARQSLSQSILRAMAYRNPAEARALLTQLSDPAMIASCEQILESIESGGTKPKVPPSPTEWVARLGQTEPGPNRITSLGYEQQNTWDRGAIQEARTAFAQLPDEQKARAAEQLSQSSGVFAPMTELRADAYRWMLENPSPQTGGGDTANRPDSLLRGTSGLATDWAQDDPQAASHWAQGLPAGDTRLWVMKNLARQWAEYEPSAASAWARSLPAAERAEVEAHLATPPR